MAEKLTLSDFTVYGKFEVRDPHTKDVVFSTDSPKISSLGQITIKGGHMTGIDITSDIRKLINKVIDEREKIKEMEEEVRQKNLMIGIIKYLNSQTK